MHFVRDKLYISFKNSKKLNHSVEIMKWNIDFKPGLDSIGFGWSTFVSQILFLSLDLNFISQAGTWNYKNDKV